MQTSGPNPKARSRQAPARSGRGGASSDVRLDDIRLDCVIINNMLVYVVLYVLAMYYIIVYYIIACYIIPRIERVVERRSRGAEDAPARRRLGGRLDAIF